MDEGLARALAAEVHGTRLVLRPLTAEHADVFFPLLQDERLYTWISMDRPQCLDTLRRHWRELEGRRSPDGSMAWPTWAVTRRDDGTVMGRVDAEVGPDLHGSLGYYLFPDHWGAGWASEAVRAAADALLERGVRRLAATVTVGHAASARVLVKAGFRLHRILPDHDTLRGVPVDDWEYLREAPAPAPADRLAGRRHP